MGARVDRFERQLEKYLSVPCAVMVNSGSSANLIAVAGAIELSGMGKLGRGVDGLRRGDEVLVPALAWSTTLAPLVQLGARPVLVDVLPDTLNMDVSAAAAKITSEYGALYQVPFWSMSTVHTPRPRVASCSPQLCRLCMLAFFCRQDARHHAGARLG